MNIYTKTGDNGMTSLYSGERVPKDSLRVEAYGTIDELDAELGMARSLCRSTNIREAILEVQKLLIRVMSEIATLGNNKVFITEADVQHIEQRIDSFSVSLLPLRSFLIPGNSPGSAALHVSRTVARRAERLLWHLSREELINENILILINRISDYSFILSRSEDNLV